MMDELMIRLFDEYLFYVSDKFSNVDVQDYEQATISRQLEGKTMNKIVDRYYDYHNPNFGTNYDRIFYDSNDQRHLVNDYSESNLFLEVVQKIFGVDYGEPNRINEYIEKNLKIYKRDSDINKILEDL